MRSQKFSTLGFFLLIFCAVVAFQLVSETAKAQVEAPDTFEPAIMKQGVSAEINWASLQAADQYKIYYNQSNDFGASPFAITTDTVSWQHTDVLTIPGAHFYQVSAEYGAETRTSRTLGAFVFGLGVPDGGTPPTATPTATPTPTSVPPASGLRHLYAFDESGGAVASDAAGLQDGQLLNGPVWQPSGGLFHGALEFDGVDDAVDLGTVDLDGSALTIAFWMKADGFDITDSRFIAKATGTAEQDHFWMVSALNGSKLRFRLKTDGTTTTQISNSGVLPIGEWVHLAATYDGSSMRLFKNGSQISSIAKTGSIDMNAAIPAAIGNQPQGGKSFDGLMDDLCIFDFALDETNLDTLMTSGCTGDGTITPPPTPTPTATPEIGNEMVVYDWNGLVTTAERGFPRDTPPMESANGDWTTPINYAEGTFYYRVEIRNQPEPQDMRLQFCVWQDNHALEACGPKEPVMGTTGNVVTWSGDIDDMWKKNNVPIDWSRPRMRWGIAIKNASGKPVSPIGDFNWGGEDPALWYPIDWRFTVVVVAKGETFSGWDTYTSP